MNDYEWLSNQEELNIVVEGESIPSPIRNLEETFINNQLKEQVYASKFGELTAIQKHAIPVGLERRDLLGIAETGTGKTLSYVLPIVECILRMPKLTPTTQLESPYALVLAPTRELAIGIYAFVQNLIKGLGLRSVCIYGGTARIPQIQEIKKGCEIMIATPGRLSDLIYNDHLKLDKCFYVVVDEMDRLLDMGFEDQLREILDEIPRTETPHKTEESATPEKVFAKHRVTALFAAKSSTQVDEWAKKYLKNPIHVIIARQRLPKDQEHRIHMSTQEEKPEKLLQVMLWTDSPVIIFTNTKRNCIAVEQLLVERGWKVNSLHGDKTQAQRIQLYKDFNAGLVDVLVCTDVAARGLDVKAKNFIHYDMASDIDCYIFRLGRYGRQPNVVSTILMSSEDRFMLHELQNEFGGKVIQTNEIKTRRLE